MKNILLPFWLFLSAVTLHGMEFSRTLSTCSNSRYSDSKKPIKDDVNTTKEMKGVFKTYLANRLKEYTKTVFPRERIDEIQKMYDQMINKKSLSYLSKCLHQDVVDEDGNTFIHSAIKAKHLYMVEWLTSVMKHPLSVPNKDGKEPIDVCIEYLVPTAQKDGREEAYKILDVLTSGYEKVNFDYNHRRNFLNKIVTLEFTHIQKGTDFVLKEDILQRFTKQDTPDCIELSEIYQEVCDAEGNTYTHMLVDRHLADILYKFIEKGYITFAKNKHQKKDPLTLAVENLSEVAGRLLDTCAPNKDFDITKVSQEDKQKRCCYVMLLNELKRQSNDDYKACCNKHDM